MADMNLIDALDERMVFDPGTMNFTPNGGDVAAVIYWPCEHRRPLRWWHRLRGQGTHLVYLDSLPAVSGNRLTLRWDAAWTFRVDPPEVA